MQTDTTIEVQCPLVVDLDGTFINTDLLHEGFLLLLRKHPLYLFKCIGWLFRGRAYLKQQVLSRVGIRAELLPYNADVLAMLRREAATGRKLVLATASPVGNAREIAAVHGLFHEVYGTEGNVNLKGVRKSDFLVARYGKGAFDYVGNSQSDLRVFDSSRYSYLVNPPPGLRSRTSKVSDLKQVWQSRGNRVRTYVRAIRMYQWVKNLLIFVPLITSHSFYSVPAIRLSVIAFFAFSLVASAGYLFNDLLDLNADRVHPRKKFRPLASGQISIVNGLLLAFVMLTGGFYLGLLLPTWFWTLLLFYFCVSFSYSFYFKRIVLYDVFILAVLYSTRVFAGALATNIPLSFWLIAFSTFMFLSLAFVKRFSELLHLKDENGLAQRGRGYFTEDISLLQTLGVASGFMSAVVFSLYIDSSEVTRLYTHPKMLWLTALLFLFWICRIWMITTRGKMTDDPIIFTMKDWISYVIFTLVGICILLAM
jgi:4-hydroxybenzoate polyprenyltransferase